MDAKPSSSFERVQHGGDLAQVVLGGGEGDVGRAAGGHVLDDEVDVDVGLGQRREHLGRFADLVGKVVDGHLRVVESVGHTGNDRLFHASVFLSYQCAGGVGETGAYPQGHVEAAGHLDAAQHHDLGAARGEFQHLVVGDEVELAGLGDDARIGGVDAVHVGEDHAGFGAQSGRQGDGGGVGAAAAERGDVLVGRDALEAGHQDDLVFLEGLLDALRPDVEDLGLGVRRCR